MSDAPLVQPLEVRVDREGRLISADDMFMQLHLRAGGVEGGSLAVPGLATLATLTHQLKMRLSRAVPVADVDDDLSLWVESQLYAGVAILSVLSWQILPARPARSPVKSSKDLPVNGESVFTFDHHSRLIGASGDLAGKIRSSDFGTSVVSVFTKLLRQDAASKALNAAAIKGQPIDERATLLSGSSVAVSAKPTIAANGDFNGYECNFAPVIMPSAQAKAATPPNILFGRQLAPVLRQPLGRIIANAETIGTELSGPIRENYALYAKDIADAARHLVALVDDLSDLEAVERPDFQTAKDIIELGDVSRRVAGLLALKAADHSIRLIAPTEDLQISVVAEFRRVLQILLNLLTNAINYSPDGTEIKIEVSKSAKEAFIMITDQGNGISADDHDRIFEKFERLGRAGDGGSGLGLYISRTLARAMDGDLTVQNAPDGGAQFTLRLPIT